LLVPLKALLCNNVGMRDWALDYLMHVIEAKNWSMNRLAQEAGVASSTINRPLRDKNWKHKLSRDTVSKVYQASGIDPKPFIPAHLAEESAMFSGPQPSRIRAILERLDDVPDPAPAALSVNEIKIAVVGPTAQIVATIDRKGLAKLRQKLDAIEAMLDD